MRIHMPVYFKPDSRTSTREVYSCILATVTKSWDGTFYAESNCLNLCGPNKLVDTQRMSVGNDYVNCPIDIVEEP